MLNRDKIENIGYTAVRRLRRQKHQNGLPFLITTKELPSKQAYLEYPSGEIDVVTIKSSNREFFVIRHLSSAEANLIRIQYHLSNL